MRSSGPLEAVIFDWGGTLTPWHTVDFEEEARALARAVVQPEPDPEVPSATHSALYTATQSVWTRSRDEHLSATLADVFATAGLTHDESLLTAYREFWEPHTLTDPDAPALLSALRADGLRVGVLSNTIWPRAWHEEFFRRDQVLDLVDGAVYTSEVPWTKPAPEVFLAAVDAVGATDASRCVYVGDRLFEDIWGAAQVGMRTILVPHSEIPMEQLGHSTGKPDAVVQALCDVLAVVRGWAGAPRQASSGSPG